MNSSANKKRFTVEEANHTLPLVRAIASDIVTHSREILERKERLKQMRPNAGSAVREADNVYNEEVLQIEEEIEKDTARLQDYVNELQALGVELKDPARGLVDFPSVMDGRDVYLCWQLGEPEVGYWHELEDGFQGRHSLLEGSGMSPNDTRLND